MNFLSACEWHGDVQERSRDSVDISPERNPQYLRHCRCVSLIIIKVMCRRAKFFASSAANDNTLAELLSHFISCIKSLLKVFTNTVRSPRTAPYPFPDTTDSVHVSRRRCPPGGKARQLWENRGLTALPNPSARQFISDAWLKITSWHNSGVTQEAAESTHTSLRKPFLVPGQKLTGQSGENSQNLIEKKKGRISHGAENTMKNENETHFIIIKDVH